MTKLSKETQEALVGRMLALKISTPDRLDRCHRVEGEGNRYCLYGWKRDDPNWWLELSHWSDTELLSLLQRAADETAGRASEGRIEPRPMSAGKTADSWAEPSGKPHGAGTFKATAHSATPWTINWADVRGVLAIDKDGAPVFAGPSKNQLRGTMEAMSNVMHSVEACCYMAEQERYYEQAQRTDKPYRGLAKDLCSKEWSRKVREGVAALQPKVRVYCQQDDD